MYATSYKINNSYTTYVIHDSKNYHSKRGTYCKPQPKLEWEKGAKVSHYFYGNGSICDITNNTITVQFQNNKACKRLANIQVVFEFACKPCELESLKLCY